MKFYNTFMSRNRKIILNFLRTALISYVTIYGSVITKNVVISNHKYLKSNSQIERDADFLSADLTVFNQYYKDVKIGTSPVNEIIRLKPNSNEPIYVYINESVNENIVSYINESLNYIQNLFETINDKYYFKIVDKTKFNFKKSIGKTTIEYNLSNFSDNLLHGLNESTTNKNSMDIKFNNSDNVYILNSEIMLNKNLYENNEDKEKILHTLNHELLHSFGFGDFYSGNLDTTSIMSPDFGFNMSAMISPNDYRALYSAYGDKHIDKHGIVDYDKFNEIKKLLNDYEKKYYDYYATKIIDSYNPLEISNQDVEQPIIFDTRSLNVLNGKFKEYKLVFDIENDVVNLNIFSSNKLVYSTSGNVVYGKNYIVFNNVKVKNKYNEYYELKHYYLIKKSNKFWLKSCDMEEFYISIEENNIDYENENTR